MIPQHLIDRKRGVKMSLKYNDYEYSNSEIAAAMGLTVNQVETIGRSAMRKIAALLEEQGVTT